MNILESIDASFSTLTKSEKKIAKFIIQNYLVNEELANYNLSNLSEIIGVGQATVVRFTNKIGFRTFADFRLKLRRDYFSNMEAENGGHTSHENSLDDFLKHSFPEEIKEKYREVAKVLMASSSIHFFGIGSSYYVAQLSAYSFFRCGKTAYSFDNIHEANMHAAVSDENDILFVISHTASTKEIVEALEYASKQKCKTILLTESGRAEACKYADHVLITPMTSTDPRNLNFITAIIQLSAIETLYREFINLDPIAIGENEDKITASIAKYNEPALG